MAILCRTCAEVREPSELQFGLVRGVNRGIAVLDWVHVEQGEGEVLGVFVLPFFADFTARSIFRTRLPCASARRAGVAHARNS